MTIFIHPRDLPDSLLKDLSALSAVAIDTESMGLDLRRDRLCLVQISGGDGHAHLVQIARGQVEAPNLKALMQNQNVTKIFHYGRFDIAMLMGWLGIATSPVYCTKTASRLCRTSTERHGLKDLLKELLGVEISKQQQTSDWGAETLSEDQKTYAASDVLYLHKLKAALDDLLKREDRIVLAQACFDFLPARAALDLAGWNNFDIFAH